MSRRQFDLFGEAAPATVGPAALPESLHALASRLSPRIRLGTSSWSFPGWAGIVYDDRRTERQLARDGLTAYAQHPLLRTVSIDRSYYGPIDTVQYAEWAADVPDDFRFGVKVDRACTTPDLRSGSGAVPNPYFLDAEHAVASTIAPALEGLGDRLGVFLFQMPPIPPRAVDGPRAFAERLRSFLLGLPAGIPIAVELRTPELFTPRYAGVLAEAGATHCFTVHPRMRDLGSQLNAIRASAGDRLVIRWMLHAGLRYEEAKTQYAPFDRLVDEDPASRETIARACIEAADEDRDAFVFINNKAEGSAPLSAVRLAETIIG